MRSIWPISGVCVHGASVLRGGENTTKEKANITQKQTFKGLRFKTKKKYCSVFSYLCNHLSWLFSKRSQYPTLSKKEDLERDGAGGILGV